MTTSDTLAARSLEDLVADQEEAEAEIGRLNALIAVHRAAICIIDAHLILRLGDGEAVQAPSGRIRFKDTGPLGSARVNTAAIDEYGAALPQECQPRITETYPSVTTIRNVAKAHRLPEGTTADTFLIPAQEGSVLRWRTLQSEAR